MSSMLPDLLLAPVRLAAPAVVAASATEVLGIAAYAAVVAVVLRTAIRWSEAVIESDAAARRGSGETDLGVVATRPTQAGPSLSSPIDRTGR